MYFPRPLLSVEVQGRRSPNIRPLRFVSCTSLSLSLSPGQRSLLFPIKASQRPLVCEVETSREPPQTLGHVEKTLRFGFGAAVQLWTSFLFTCQTTCFLFRFFMVLLYLYDAIIDEYDESRDRSLVRSFAGL